MQSLRAMSSLECFGSSLERGKNWTREHRRLIQTSFSVFLALSFSRSVRPSTVTWKIPNLRILLSALNQRENVWEKANVWEKEKSRPPKFTSTTQTVNIPDQSDVTLVTSDLPYYRKFTSHENIMKANFWNLRSFKSCVTEFHEAFNSASLIKWRLNFHGIAFFNFFLYNFAQIITSCPNGIDRKKFVPFQYGNQKRSKINCLLRVNHREMLFNNETLQFIANN